MADESTEPDQDIPPATAEAEQAVTTPKKIIPSSFNDTTIIALAVALILISSVFLYNVLWQGKEFIHEPQGLAIIDLSFYERLIKFFKWACAAAAIALVMWNFSKRINLGYRHSASITDDPSIGFVMGGDVFYDKKSIYDNFFIHTLTKRRGENFLIKKPMNRYVPISTGRMEDLRNFAQKLASKRDTVIIYGLPDLANHYFNENLPFWEAYHGQCHVIALRYVERGPTASPISMYRKGFGWRTYQLWNSALWYQAAAYKLLLSNINEADWPYIHPNELDAKANLAKPPERVVEIKKAAIASPSYQGVATKQATAQEVADIVSKDLEQKFKTKNTDTLIEILKPPKR